MHGGHTTNNYARMTGITQVCPGPSRMHAQPEDNAGHTYTGRSLTGLRAKRIEESCLDNGVQEDKKPDNNLIY